MKALIGVVGLLVSTGVFAQKALVFCNNAFPPYVVETSEGGKTVATGSKVEVLQAILKQAGLPPAEVRLMPWPRCQDEVKQGNVDGLLPTFKTPDRESYAAFTAPVMKQKAVFVYSKVKYPKGFPTWTSYDSIKQLRLGMLIGGSIDPDMEKAFSTGKEILRNANMENMLKMVEADRLDVVALDRTLAQFLIKKEKLDAALDVSSQNINDKEAYIGLSQKSGAAKHVAALNTAIAELQKSKALDQILAK